MKSLTEREQRMLDEFSKRGEFTRKRVCKVIGISEEGRALDMSISRLRKKAAGMGLTIKTVYGVGYVVF